MIAASLKFATVAKIWTLSFHRGVSSAVAPRATTLSRTKAMTLMRSNGEVEGPDDASGRTQVERSSPGAPDAAEQAPRAHNLLQRPRRQAAGASRHPRTIVRRHAYPFSEYPRSQRRVCGSTEKGDHPRQA